MLVNEQLLHEDKAATRLPRPLVSRGFDNVEIKMAYERAKTSQSYDKVERWFSNGRPNTEEKAYAMTNPMEYFAESTEAFFSRNDFFPFTRDEFGLWLVGNRPIASMMRVGRFS